MLKDRVITAIVLLAVFLGSLLFLPSSVFTTIVGVFFAIGAWEWSNLSGIPSKLLKIGYVALVSFIALLLGLISHWGQQADILKPVFLVACFWWAIALLWIQGFPSSSVIWGRPIVRALMGLLVLIPAWLSCLYLIQEPNGIWLVLMVVLVVAAADVGAYFTGKAIGKRKLAPNVSPGKSWEGVWGGMVFAGIVGAAFNTVFGADQWGALMLILLPTAFISVVGDLLESMVKRHRGIKDSSQLLPGHGGVLDRVDGLVAATPVFSLLLILTSFEL